LIERGQIANSVTLKSYFDQDGALAEIGGAVYLARLAASVVTIINTGDYGRTIHDLDSDAVQQIESAEKRLFDLAETGQMDGGFRPFDAALKTAIGLAEAAFK